MNPDEIESVVRQHTAGRGADIVIESIDLPALYAKAFE